jgi:hypothetical protein
VTSIPFKKNGNSLYDLISKARKYRTFIKPRFIRWRLPRLCKGEKLPTMKAHENAKTPNFFVTVAKNLSKH